MSHAPAAELPTLVVGAGAAGLVTARALAARGLAYDHVERHAGLGGIWDIDAPASPMYEAAHFISSRTVSGFPGYPMADDLPDYPAHRDVLAYLRGFARDYGLAERVRCGVAVEDVTRRPDGVWRATFADTSTADYGAIVCCNGREWDPRMPELPGTFSGDVIHSARYRDLDDVRGRRVMIIGGGNSACDIAVDAGRVASRAIISMRRGYHVLPKHLFGRPTDTLAQTGPSLPPRVQRVVMTGLLRVLYGDLTRLGLQAPDHRLFETHPVVNSNLLLALQHGDVIARPGISAIDDRTVRFVDGRQEEVDLIICATGYRHTVPYAQRYITDHEHPDLFLSTFSREHEGLYANGYVGAASGSYRHFDACAQMLACHLLDRETNMARYATFRRIVETAHPDLSGGVAYDASPRHRGYANADVLRAYRQELIDQLGWTMHEEPPVGTGATPAAV